MKMYNQQQIMLGGAFLILIFVLAVAYQYTSVKIQKEKEISVINSRAEAQKKNDYELQSQCAKAAETFKANNFPNSSHSNYYSTDHGKCFINLVTIKRNDKIRGWNYSVYVMDVNQGFNGKLYAQLEMTTTYDLENGDLGFQDSCTFSSDLSIKCEVLTCQVDRTSCRETTEAGERSRPIDSYYYFNRLTNEYGF